ncbi:hypothetical protein V8C42DRAFT_46517 [Trichoderma barbatum]
MFFYLISSTGRTAGKHSNMFQHGLMIRYPLEIFLVPATTHVLPPGLMDNEFSIILWGLYLIIDSICCVCIHYFLCQFMHLLIFLLFISCFVFGLLA